MRRLGHQRPLGTVTSWRRFQWPAREPPPELGDVAIETDGPGGRELERAFLVVGIEERDHGSRWRYALQLERIDPATAEPLRGCRTWSWYRVAS